MSLETTTTQPLNPSEPFLVIVRRRLAEMAEAARVEAINPVFNNDSDSEAYREEIARVSAQAIEAINRRRAELTEAELEEMVAADEADRAEFEAMNNRFIEAINRRSAELTTEAAYPVFNDDSDAEDDYSHRYPELTRAEAAYPSSFTEEEYEAHRAELAREEAFHKALEDDDDDSDAEDDARNQGSNSVTTPVAESVGAG